MENPKFTDIRVLTFSDKSQVENIEVKQDSKKSPNYIGFYLFCFGVFLGVSLGCYALYKNPDQNKINNLRSELNNTQNELNQIKQCLGK